jgi:predicted  nucleic acid-binding Zn-ribbon protein
MVWPHPAEAPKSAVGDLASEIEREIANLLAQKQALEVQVNNLNSILDELGPKAEALTREIALKQPKLDKMKKDVRDLLKVLDGFSAKKDAAA